MAQTTRLGDIQGMTGAIPSPQDELLNRRAAAVQAHGKLNELERQGHIQLRQGRITARDPLMKRRAEALMRRVQDYADESGEDPGYEWEWKD